VKTLLALKDSRNMNTQNRPKRWSLSFVILAAVTVLVMSALAAEPPYPYPSRDTHTTAGLNALYFPSFSSYSATRERGISIYDRLNLVSATLAQNQGIDMQKVQKIRGKRQRGEPLTPEDIAYMRRFQAERKKRYEAYKKEHPPRDTTGLVPLNERGKETYKEQEGGLYPRGTNAPPEGHLKAGLEMARKIVPLDKEGNLSKDGKIVFLSIGMSNTTQEFQVFKKVAEADPALNPQVVIVDGAQGGQTAKVTANAEARFWQVIDQRLEEANVTPKQVQAAWIKQANGGPTRPFPEEVKFLKECLVTNLHILADRFPNLRIAYISSRIYAGYTQVGGSPEPHAYESGFAVKWLIADQIAGNPELNYVLRKEM